MARLGVVCILVTLWAAPALAVELRSPPGALHGFPSMSDATGSVIADGELVQERRGEHLYVRGRWVFSDGRVAEETAVFELSPELAQQRFAWVEKDHDRELRHFEVNFESGRASSAVRRDDGSTERSDEKLDLPTGRSFAGYGIALAASQFELGDGSSADLTFVAFTPKPRSVTLQVRNDGNASVVAAGRAIPCLHYRLHPKIPFPISVFAHAEDAHLWLTRGAPHALVRAEQNLVAKDDPRVTIDVIPRGPARPPSAANSAR